LSWDFSVFPFKFRKNAKMPRQCKFKR
jgi:hypothetical protein